MIILLQLIFHRSTLYAAEKNYIYTFERSLKSDTNLFFDFSKMYDFDCQFRFYFSKMYHMGKLTQNQFETGRTFNTQNDAISFY